MKDVSQNSWLNSEFVKLSNPEDLEGYRVAGRITAGALDLLESLVKKQTSLSLLELDKLAEEYIRDNNCTPVFKNYKNFPNTCCMSVNNQLVHAIPTDYHLKPGDLISFDTGALFNNKFVGDSARTHVFCEAKSEIHERLIQTTKDALQAGINAIKIDAHIGVIGEAIYKVAKKAGFEVINVYGGHSVGYSKEGIGIPHTSPFVANKSEKDIGCRIQNNMMLCLEPLVVLGSSTKTTIADNKWDVSCESICSHVEVTLIIHKDKVEILT